MRTIILKNFSLFNRQVDIFPPSMILEVFLILIIIKKYKLHTNNIIIK